MTHPCGESLGLLTMMLQRQEEKEEHEEEEEQEDGGSGERQRGESCLRYYLFASSAKNAVPVAQAPCQHRMTEGTVHRITV